MQQQQTMLPAKPIKPEAAILFREAEEAREEGLAGKAAHLRAAALKIQTGITREQAQEYYRRVRAWEAMRMGRLHKEILVRYFAGMDICRHNWSINYEAGRGGITREAYRAGKRYKYLERRTWDASRRLLDHFGQYFY